MNACRIYGNHIPRPAKERQNSSNCLRRWRFVMLALLAGFLAGCATTAAPPPADPHLLDFLRDGQSTKEAVVLKLGQPSSVLESGRILTYRLGQENIRGYFLREAANTNWFELKFSLVLVFDASEELERHSLVEVR